MSTFSLQKCITMLRNSVKNCFHDFSNIFKVFWSKNLFSKSANSCMTSLKRLSSVLLEKSWIFLKNDTISREEFKKSRIFHNFLSFRRSADDMGDILWRNYFRTVTFLNFVLFQFRALFFRPMFKPLEIPYNWKLFQKPSIDHIYIS